MTITVKAHPVGDAEHDVHGWNPALHPRDRHGRFISTGGHVRLGDGSIGKVVHNLGNGKVEIQHADGSTVTADAHSLAVVNPTTKLTDAVTRAPHAAVEPTAVRHLREGDTAMIPHPLTGEPAAGTIIDRRPHGDHVELDVRRADGSVDTADMDRDHVVDKIISDANPDDFPDDVPKPPARPRIIDEPAPSGVLLARPAMYTYQRQKLVTLGLDRDHGQDPAVRQAAAAVRLRMPLTAGQSTALADAVREQAKGDGVRPVQARSLERIAGRLDAAAAEVHGHAPPDLGKGRDGAVATHARDLTEGDSVALADRAGNVHVVKVHGVKTTMGGRITQLEIEHDDGTRETRTVTGRTKTWLLPDRPDDTPVPPPGDRREHVTPDRLRVGDTVLDNYGDKRVLTKITPGRATVTELRGTSTDPERRALPDEGHYQWPAGAEDGGPSVIRVGRGPASAEQPWDQVMPPEHPERIEPSQIRIGDRISVGERAFTTTGVVEHADDVTGEDGKPGKILSVREDNGQHYALPVFDGDGNATITRLIKGDDNAADRIERARLAREQEARAKEIRGMLDEISAAQRKQDVAVLQLARFSRDDDHVEKSITRYDIAGQLRTSGAKTRLIEMLAPPGDDREGRAERLRLADERITPLLTDIGQRNREQLIASLRNATAGLTNQRDIDDARLRVADQFRETPPPLDSGTAARALAKVAAAMREAHGGGAVPDVPDVPVLPAGANLADRIAAYRAALPADRAGIGHRQVQRAMFAAPRLADLEAGRAPAVTMAHVNIPDVAADNGPGEVAMRHLDTVMAAGKDLDDELQRRINTRFGPDRVAASDTAADRIRAFQKEREPLWGTYRSRERGRDAVAQHFGFDNFRRLINRMDETPLDERGGAEYQRLQSLRDSAQQAGEQQVAKDQARFKELSGQIEHERASVISDKDRATAQREAVRGILNEVRPDGMGGTRLDYRAATGKGQPLTDRSELVKAMRFAESNYPASWLQHARDGAPGGTLQLGTADRGYHRGHEIRLSKDINEGTDGAGMRGRVATHELGHEMEGAVPGVLPLEHSYLWSRTSTGPAGSRKREPRVAMKGYKNEAAYHDEFPEPYSGKDYPGSSPAVPSRNYELLTTGMESLMAGSKYLDPSMRQWLLGTLATT